MEEVTNVVRSAPPSHAGQGRQPIQLRAYMQGDVNVIDAIMPNSQERALFDCSGIDQLTANRVKAEFFARLEEDRQNPVPPLRVLPLEMPVSQQAASGARQDSPAAGRKRATSATGSEGIDGPPTKVQRGAIDGRQAIPGAMQSLEDLVGDLPDYGERAVPSPGAMNDQGPRAAIAKLQSNLKSNIASWTPAQVRQAVDSCISDINASGNEVGGAFTVFDGLDDGTRKLTVDKLMQAHSEAEMAPAGNLESFDTDAALSTSFDSFSAVWQVSSALDQCLAAYEQVRHGPGEAPARKTLSDAWNDYQAATLAYGAPDEFKHRDSTVRGYLDTSSRQNTVQHPVTPPGIARRPPIVKEELAKARSAPARQVGLAAVAEHFSKSPMISEKIALIAKGTAKSLVAASRGLNSHQIREMLGKVAKINRDAAEEMAASLLSGTILTKVSNGRKLEILEGVKGYLPKVRPTPLVKHDQACRLALRGAPEALRVAYEGMSSRS